MLDSIKRDTYPQLLPKEDIKALENSVEEGIPHFVKPVEVPKLKK
jgi:hypothetical protein